MLFARLFNCQSQLLEQGHSISALPPSLIPHLDNIVL